MITQAKSTSPADVRRLTINFSLALHTRCKRFVSLTWVRSLRVSHRDRARDPVGETLRENFQSVFHAMITQGVKVSYLLHVISSLIGCSLSPMRSAYAMEI